ncbi:MAG: AMP-binding protein, partial [Microthrixaceae bacterium]|nr:AMP-binding protein [Microthrixaceae bacterium]
MDEPHLPTLFDAIARQRPRAAAIRTSTEATSWAELAARTDSLAAALVRAGVGSTDGPTEAWECPNDRVALYLHNHPAYLESMVAAWKARGTAMNVNYRYRAAELTELLEDAAPRAIVYHRCFTPTLSEVLGRLSDPPDLLICVADESEHRLLPGAVDYEELSTRGGAPPEATQDAWSPDDRYLVYTGGTTGTPKGVLWRQCDFAVSALGFDPEAVERAGGPAAWAAGLPTPGPVTLPAPPFMHGAAHWNALAAWLKGGTVVLPEHPERFDADSLLDAVEWSGASALIIVGDAFARPLLAADEARHRGLPTLRHLLTGGAILSPSVKAELIRRWPHVTVVDVLGSSESGRQAVHRHRAVTAVHPHRAATAVPGPSKAAVTAEPDARTFRPDDDTVIVDDAVARLVEPPTSHDGDSEVGWLARGGRVPLGYLGHPDQTRATFPVLDGRRLAVTGDRARYRST